MQVRPRSILGAKYLALTPGHAKKRIPANGMLPLSHSMPVVEFDEAFNVFDHPTTEGLRSTLRGLGDALAGRGNRSTRRSPRRARCCRPPSACSACWSRRART